MAQRIQTQVAKSAFMALALTISFATVAATTSAASYPNDGSKETLAKPYIVPEVSGADAVSPHSTKKPRIRKKEIHTAKQAALDLSGLGGRHPFW